MFLKLESSIDLVEMYVWSGLVLALNHSVRILPDTIDVIDVNMLLHICG